MGTPHTGAWHCLAVLVSLVSSERAETVGRLESFMGRQDGNSTSPQERLQNIGLVYFQINLPPPTTLNV
jgi:hypothetical protein